MSASLLLTSPVRDEVASYLEPRAAGVDAGRTDVRPALAFLQERALRDGASEPDGDLARVAATIATAAWSDLATAFALWCHRMVLEYLAAVPAQLPARRELLPPLIALERIGSTGLAPAMAHVVSGAPLSVRAREVDRALVLEGKVRWASNLFAPGFVVVTAAALDEGAAVVALGGEQDGVRVEAYPELVALQATASSSLALEGACVSADRVISRDLAAFVRRVRPTFLILQSAFCWGLARRALDEAASIASASVLDPQRRALEQRAEALASALGRAAGDRPADARPLVALRLEAACLATEAVALELRAAGSRAYARSSPTARRLREAAFLPIQAPTEVQLRSELATPTVARPTR